MIELIGGPLDGAVMPDGYGPVIDVCSAGESRMHRYMMPCADSGTALRYYYVGVVDDERNPDHEDNCNPG